jgi:spermidine synthase
MMILTILIIGASGLIAQVITLRELLVSFYGNELTLGIILANWMLLEAGGVYFLGRLVDRVNEKYGLMALMQLVFVWGFVFAVYLARTFKFFSGAFFGQGLSLVSIYLWSFVVMLAIGFSHGGLFAVCCRVFQGQVDQPHSGIGKVYTWETIGSILAGVLLTYILIPFFNSFQLVQLVALVNLAVAFWCVLAVRSRKLQFCLGTVLVVSLFLFVGVNPSRLQDGSLSRQYKSSEIVDYRNSIYANIIVTRNSKQEVLFYNGIPSIFVPDPDISSIEEFGHLPLFFSSHPRKVLLVGSGLGGLIQEILKHPISKLDYLEIDPQIMEALKRVDPGYIGRVVIDPRLKIINQDSRFFLLSSREKYDLILLGSIGPSDLVSNRLFTQEFFALAKKHLENEGIISLRLNGSLTYLSRQLRDLNFSIINSLKANFENVRVIPGDFNLILSSDSSEIGLGADEVYRRVQLSGLQTKTLVPSYLRLRLDKQWLEWFNRASLGATRKMNRDFHPIALFQSLLIWNRQFSPVAAGIFEGLSGFDLLKVSLVIIGIFLIFLFAGENKKIGANRNLSLVYCLAATGFWGMMVNLELVFGFQVSFGYVYKIIGLLIAVFMSGIALSSSIAMKISDRGRGLKYLLVLEVAMVIFSIILSQTVSRAIAYSFSGMVIYILMFFAGGSFLGLEFVLCALLYKQSSFNPGNAGGKLYSADLLGGCVAGFLGGIWLLPVLGIGGCGLLLSLIKATSFVLLKKQK